MVAKRQCSFCAREIEPGTGTIYVKRDGTVYQFCSSSCRKQQLHLGRIGHRFKWTRAYELKRAAERSTAEREAGVPSPPSPSLPGKIEERPVPPAPASIPSAAEAPGRPAPAPAAETEPVVPAASPPKKPRAKSAGKGPRKPAATAATKPAAKPSPDHE